MVGGNTDWWGAISPGPNGSYGHGVNYKNGYLWCLCFAEWLSQLASWLRCRVHRLQSRHLINFKVMIFDANINVNIEYALSTIPVLRATRIRLFLKIRFWLPIRNFLAPPVTWIKRLGGCASRLHCFIKSSTASFGSEYWATQTYYIWIR